MASAEAGKEEEEEGEGVGSRHRILLCNVPNDIWHTHASTRSVSAHEGERTLLLSHDVLYWCTFLATWIQLDTMAAGFHGTLSSSWICSSLWPNNSRCFECGPLWQGPRSAGSGLQWHGCWHSSTTPPCYRLATGPSVWWCLGECGSEWLGEGWQQSCPGPPLCTPRLVAWTGQPSQKPTPCGWWLFLGGTAQKSNVCSFWWKAVTCVQQNCWPLPFSWVVLVD